MIQVSVITPNLNMGDWLPLCVASVEDQQGVDIEHIIQDGGSSDHTLAWLRERSRASADATSGSWEHVRDDGSHYRLIWSSQQDAGMYDAVNKGLNLAKGAVCAYLNADEQYLPGSLQYMHDHFISHAQHDIVFGDAVITNADGDYCCSRQVLVPTWLHTRTCSLGVLTAAMFFRRRILEDHDMYFDTSWRNIGDVEWVLRAMQKGISMAVVRRYISVFTETGNNLNLNPSGDVERQRLRGLSPQWPCWFTPLWTLLHRFRRLLHGLYHPKPFSYDLYTRVSPQKRVTRQVAKPTFYWRGRFFLMR